MDPCTTRLATEAQRHGADFPFKECPPPSPSNRNFRKGIFSVGIRGLTADVRGRMASLSTVLRASLACAALLISVGCGEPVGESDSASFEAARREFVKLKAQWEVEIKAVSFSSDTADRWTGPAAHAIVGMRKRALPFVMEEIKQGNFFFNIAAVAITGTDQGQGLWSEQERSRKWVQWWDRTSKDPTWNIFLSK